MLRQVLVVDDMSVIRHLLMEIMKRLDFERSGASKGRVALDLLARKKFDLVLCDWCTRIPVVKKGKMNQAGFSDYAPHASRYYQPDRDPTPPVFTGFISLRWLILGVVLVNLVVTAIGVQALLHSRQRSFEQVQGVGALLGISNISMD